VDSFSSIFFIVSLNFSILSDITVTGGWRFFFPLLSHHYTSNKVDHLPYFFEEATRDGASTNKMETAAGVFDKKQRNKMASMM
jgi:hypothetical protein